MYSTFSGLYAQMYNSIHSNKDYNLEIKLLVDKLKIEFDEDLTKKKFFDFGCGTGNHMSELSKLGYFVEGYDMSSDMLDIAKSSFPKLNFYSFLPQDVKFDVVYSLFDVASYQLSDESFDRYLMEMSSLIHGEGILVFDGWHTSGVALSPPQNRSQSVESLDHALVRKVSASYSARLESTELSIDLIDVNTNSVLQNEVHSLRSFSVDYLREALKRLNFQKIAFFEPSDFNSPLTEASWRFVVLASKIKDAL